MALLALVISGCCYAAWAGGPAGRYAAPILLLSAASSGGLVYVPGIYLMIAADVICFLSVWVLAVHLAPKWIVYCGGLQCAKLATHVAACISPDISPGLYEALLDTFFLLMIAAAMFGIWAGRRRAASEAPR